MDKVTWQRKLQLQDTLDLSLRVKCRRKHFCLFLGEICLNTASPQGPPYVSYFEGQMTRVAYTAETSIYRWSGTSSVFLIQALEPDPSVSSSPITEL